MCLIKVGDLTKKTKKKRKKTPLSDTSFGKIFEMLKKYSNPNF
ncbi:hypothetical protein ACNSOL_12115 (plasmid) [Aliarcobacter lanthieri]